MINVRLFSAKHKLLEQHNGEFEKWSGHQIYLTKNKFVYTVSIKCTSKKVIAEALKKFEIDDFKGTDYISFIKGLTKV